MREIVKKYTHNSNGEELVFQVHKMNALAGSYMIKFVAEKLIPLIDGFQSIFVEADIDTEEKAKEAAQKRTDAIMEVIPKALASISESELYSFQKQCLNNVEMMLPAGWQKVMTGDAFGVEEVEYDPILALILCYDVIEFNFSGFFAGVNSRPLLPRQNTSSQNV